MLHSVARATKLNIQCSKTSQAGLLQRPTVGPNRALPEASMQTLDFTAQCQHRYGAGCSWHKTLALQSSLRTQCNRMFLPLHNLQPIGLQALPAATSQRLCGPFSTTPSLVTLSHWQLATNSRLPTCRFEVNQMNHTRCDAAVSQRSYPNMRQWHSHCGKVRRPGPTKAFQPLL